MTYDYPTPLTSGTRWNSITGFWDVWAVDAGTGKATYIGSFNEGELTNGDAGPWAEYHIWWAFCHGYFNWFVGGVFSKYN